MKIPLLLISGLVLASAAFGQDWAKARLEKSPRHTEFVALKEGGRTVNCFVAYPEVKDKAPAVLIIHEIFGLSDWAKELADEVAAAGYVAIAPDLLSGQGPNGGGTQGYVDAGQKDHVMPAVSRLPPEQVTADLDAAADYIEKVPACNGKLAVAGFCWGGGQSFRFATHRTDLKAAFVFYGTPPPPEAMAEISCPVYGFYAENDARITATVPDTAAAMENAGKTYESKVYPGAGHGFMRAGEDPAGSDANKQARAQAWTRWMEVMKAL
jgi:carboxymethylenebutenolidase